MGARWYEARIGRWVSADTIVPDPADPQSLNRYAYVLQNPLRYIDPTGHMHWTEDSGGGTGSPYPLSTLTPDLWALCDTFAGQYGVPVELVAGVIAIEIDHDTEVWDAGLDAAALWLISCANGTCPPWAVAPARRALYKWDFLTRRGPGPGVANFHTETARRVEAYFRAQYPESPGLQLPYDATEGHPNAYWRIEYLVSDQGSVHYTAAYLRMLADYRMGSGGAPDPGPHMDLSVTDMAVIAGAFRAGIIRGWDRVVDYQGAEVGGSLGNLVLPYLARYGFRG
jgi:hypothetical protein